MKNYNIPERRAMKCIEFFRNRYHKHYIIFVPNKVRGDKRKEENEQDLRGFWYQLPSKRIWKTKQSRDSCSKI